MPPNVNYAGATEAGIDGCTLFAIAFADRLAELPEPFTGRSCCWCGTPTKVRWD